MRRRGINSPDIADAMSFAFLDLHYNISGGSMRHKEQLLDQAMAELGL